MSGWYKQWRDIFDRKWAKDPKMVAVYVYLHTRAYVYRGDWHGQTIERGSCPTSRSAIMEGTGLTEQEVKSRMQKLVDYGEIIIKSSNHGTIVTVCDYDVYEVQEDLFGFESSSQHPANNPAGNQQGTSLYKKEGRIKEDNLINPFSLYKNERERKMMVKEIQKKYNEMFEGQLPPYMKMYLPTQLKVEECVRRFGRASVDLVLEQVSMEPFSMGHNKTGFRASFQHIFEPSEFQKYLERAQLRLKKESKPTGKSSGSAIVAIQEPIATRQAPDDYEREMRAAAAKGNAHAMRLVEQWDKDNERNNKQ